jgi:hypothetical protein
VPVWAGSERNIAPPFRFGSGDITDASGNRSGQLDVVIEYGNSITFPNILPKTPRLYLAEGVCAVVDVKSALSTHWNEVTRSTAMAAACAFLSPMRSTRRAPWNRGRAESGPTFQVRRLGEFGIRRSCRAGDARRAVAVNALRAPTMLASVAAILDPELTSHGADALRTFATGY